MNNRFTAPPPNTPVQLDLERMDSFHCPRCSSSGFVSVMTLYEVPSLIAPPPNNVIRTEMLMCIGCQNILQPQQLSKMTANERKDLEAKIIEQQKQAELQRQN